MKIIKPTRDEVWEELKHGDGCCWLGGDKCHCYNRDLKECFAYAEKRLTKTEYTEEEIMESRARNAKFIEEIQKLLAERDL